MRKNLTGPYRTRGVYLTLGALAAAVVLGGCAEMPTGPTVAVWPAPGKPFEVFRADDAACRRYAAAGIDPNAANAATAQRVALGTAAGAVAGALIADSGAGAGVGAGVGLLAGSAAGAGAGERDNRSAQRRYNIAYEQCMYAKGNQIPGAPRQAYYPPPPGG